MKYTLLIICILSILSSLSAQEERKNTVYITAAPSAIRYDYKGNVDGGGAYNGQTSYSVGLEYSRQVFRNFELLTGLHYAHNKIEYKAPFYPDVAEFKGSFHLNYISIPLQVKYRFCNYFFVNGGGILNLKVSSIDEYHYSYEKDKIGFLFGIGTQIDFKNKYSFVLNPYFQSNFLSGYRNMDFYNLGVKIGLGYSF